jgi:hypothetical protein
LATRVPYRPAWPQHGHRREQRRIVDQVTGPARASQLLPQVVDNKVPERCARQPAKQRSPARTTSRRLDALTIAALQQVFEKTKV